MPRVSAAQHALSSALGNLWALHELVDEATRLDNIQAGRLIWSRYAHDATYWVRLVTAAGRASDLPPSLLNNRAYYNEHGFNIPDVKGSDEKWRR